MASGIGMWEMEAPSEESKLEPRDTSNVCCGVLASFPMRIDDFPSGERAISVSYTHLTLPTICSV